MIGFLRLDSRKQNSRHPGTEKNGDDSLLRRKECYLCVWHSPRTKSEPSTWAYTRSNVESTAQQNGRFRRSHLRPLPFTSISPPDNANVLVKGLRDRGVPSSPKARSASAVPSVGPAAQTLPVGTPALFTGHFGVVRFQIQPFVVQIARVVTYCVLLVKIRVCVALQLVD